MVMKLSMLKGLSADEAGHEEDFDDLPTPMSSGSDRTGPVFSIISDNKLISSISPKKTKLTKVWSL